ncbi:hypothetical protein L6Q79_10375 [bacterium]|nr:hypothetical protein [bacterium]NUN45937.1 hypothetical protein [bacterium]
MSPGIAYKLTNKVALELTMGRVYYSKSEVKPKGAPSSLAIKNKNYGLNLDLKHVELGIELYLSR